MDSWFVPELKEYLLQYNITPKDIKGSGKNGNVVKKDLVRTAKKISKVSSKKQTNTFPSELTDVVPTIIGHLDYIKQREINKYYNQKNSIKDILYHFIIKTYPYNNIDDMIDHFPTFDLFKAYQREIIDDLSDDLVKFLTYYMYLINHGKIDQMDKESMTPYQTKSFAFFENKILIYTDYTENVKVDMGNPQLHQILPDDRESIYNYIIKHFDDYDLNRMSDYYYEENDLPIPSMKSVKKYQMIQVANMTNDMTDFLYQYIELIRKKNIFFSTNNWLFNFRPNGFIFLNDRAVIFNER